MMRWYIKVLKQYADFSGRARRKEFWLFTIIDGVIKIVLSVVPFLGLVYSLVTLIPAIAVQVRRLHDVGKSGGLILYPWLFFLVFLVFGWFVIRGGMQIGSLGVMVVSLIWLGLMIWIFVLMLLDSQPGNNRYGPNPKGVEIVNNEVNA